MSCLYDVNMQASCKTTSSDRASLALQDIPKILPLILNCIRMIWSLSRFYNTPERLVGLLRKLSNEIVNRCCAGISLPDIFGGEVDNVTVALEQVHLLRMHCSIVMQHVGVL